MNDVVIAIGVLVIGLLGIPIAGFGLFRAFEAAERKDEEDFQLKMTKLSAEIAQSGRALSEALTAQQAAQAVRVAAQEIEANHPVIH